MIAVDTETTGVDFWHGARPFFVSICREDGTQLYYEWPVNPHTRRVIYDPQDLRDILNLVTEERAESVVLHNAKFDVHALAMLDDDFDRMWNWRATDDTLIASHLLASNLPHDLTSLAMQYLYIDIEPYEIALKSACMKARSLARRKYKKWYLAKKGLPHTPSAAQTSWKYDTWLPRVIAISEGYSTNHPWHTVLRDYSNVDTSVTIALWKIFERLLRERDLLEIYKTSLQRVQLAYRMERDGVTISQNRLIKLETQYNRECELSKNRCLRIADSKGYELNLPRGAVNNSLKVFCYDVLQLPKVYNVKSKTANPTLDSKSAIPYYLSTLKDGSIQKQFIENLSSIRSRSTALAYMEGYKRYWKPSHNGLGCYLIHPNLNPTGTDTLRWSSNNPNEQNISKRQGFNLRYAFGPATGREWYSLDAKNIERRIPAYEAGEDEIIALFERPDDPPYYGSEHLLVAHLIYPKLFEECKGKNGELDGRIFKKKYVDSYYQRTKNGNFAIQYGAQEDTADRTFRVSGAYKILKKRFQKQEALNQWCISFASKHGYIETIPDKTVNPRRGYPLLVTRTEFGRAIPTVPLNYRTSGTAMWWMMKAMIRCQRKLDEWHNEEDTFDGRIAMQVHDELTFDFPVPSKPRGNVWRIRILRNLMEQGGDDIGIPTPVNVEYHEHNWSEGITIA